MLWYIVPKLSVLKTPYIELKPIELSKSFDIDLNKARSSQLSDSV